MAVEFRKDNEATIATIDGMDVGRIMRGATGDHVFFMWQGASDHEFASEDLRQIALRMEQAQRRR